MYIKWSPEELEILIRYHGSEPFIELSKKLPNRTPASLQKKSIKLKLKSNYRFKKYQVNLNFWNQINHISSYFAGLIAADGSIYKKKNALKWSLNSKDRCLLEKFKSVTEFTGPIKDYKNDVSFIGVCGQEQWIKDLSSIWNITPNKTFTLKPPKIEEDYIWSYIIGFIDGDGWITDNSNTFTIGFVNASKEILEWIKMHLDRVFPNCTRRHFASIRKSNHGNYFTYLVGGLRAYIIFDFLNQINCPKSDRKWKNPKILSKLEYYKTKYLYLFEKKSLRSFSSV